MSSTPPPTATPAGHLNAPGAGSLSGSGGFFSSSDCTSAEPRSPTSKRSSGFWGQEVGWDACHEISAESGEGVEEVFRVVTRKLVEQNRKMSAALLAATATPGLTPGLEGQAGSYEGAGGPGGYFDGANSRGANSRGSFRVGRDRRSWLFSPNFSPAVTIERGASTQQQQDGEHNRPNGQERRGKKCC